VRLSNRVGPWFRVASLGPRYQDIESVARAVEELCGGIECREHGGGVLMVRFEEAMDRSELSPMEGLWVLSAEELRTVVGRASLPDPSSFRQHKTKGALVEALKKAAAPNTWRLLSGRRVSDELLKAVRTVAGPLIAIPPEVRRMFRRVHFLFHLAEGVWAGLATPGAIGAYAGQNGTEGQRLAWSGGFLKGGPAPPPTLASIGRKRFPPYQCNASLPVFTSRSQLEDYEKAKENEAEMEIALMHTRDEAKALELGQQAHDHVAQHVQRMASAAVAPAAAAAAAQPSTSAAACAASSSAQHHHPQQGSSSSGDDADSAKYRHVFLRRFTAEWVHAGVAWHSVQILEKRKQYEEAVARLRLLLHSQLSVHRRGKWYNRLTINLHRNLSRSEEALQYCIQGLREGAAVPRGDRIELGKRTRRIATAIARATSKKAVWSREIPSDLRKTVTEASEFQLLSNIRESKVLGRPLDDSKAAGQHSVFVGFNDKCVGVEGLILQHYRMQGGWTGVHTEGREVRELFGILMYDVLFDEAVGDVLQTPYQDAPLDLGTECFYACRKTKIDNRLRGFVQATPDEMRILTATSVDRLYGLRIRGVTWTTPRQRKDKALQQQQQQQQQQKQQKQQTGDPQPTQG